MNKLFNILICFSLTIVFVSCSESSDEIQSSQEKIQYIDGIYSAVSTEASETGYKDEVIIEVKDRAIISVDYNGYTENGLNKKTESHGGSYDMTIAGALKPWHEQAELLENSLVELQDPDAIKVDDEGYTDAIAGVSINVQPFVELSKEALNDAEFEK